MNERERVLALPEIVTPDWPRWASAIGQAAIAWLRETRGVVGAWIAPEALDDGRPADEVTMLVVMDPGLEVSDGIEAEGKTLVIAGISEDVLRDTLEIDPEYAQIVAHGYRLCGVDKEIFELSALAKEIVVS